MAKYVYSFGGGKADGKESMKNLLSLPLKPAP